MNRISFQDFVARAKQGSGRVRLSGTSAEPRLAARKSNPIARAADHLRRLGQQRQENVDLTKRFVRAVKLSHGTDVARAVEKRLQPERGRALDGARILDASDFADRWKARADDAVLQAFSPAQPFNVFQAVEEVLPAYDMRSLARGLRAELGRPDSDFRHTVEAHFRAALGPAIEAGDNLGAGAMKRALRTAVHQALLDHHVERSQAFGDALRQHGRRNLPGLTEAAIASLGCGPRLADKRQRELLQPQGGFTRSVLAMFSQRMQQRCRVPECTVDGELLDAELIDAFQQAFYLQALQQPTLLHDVLRSPVICLGLQPTTLAAELDRGILPPPGSSPDELRLFAKVALQAVESTWNDTAPVAGFAPPVTGRTHAARLLLWLVESGAHRHLDVADQQRLARWQQTVDQAARNLNA